MHGKGFSLHRCRVGAGRIFGGARPGNRTVRHARKKPPPLKTINKSNGLALLACDLHIPMTA